MNKKNLTTIFLLIIVCFVSSCNAAQPSGETVAASEITTMPPLPAEEVDENLSVLSWVEDARSAEQDGFILWGSLLKGDTRLSAMSMRATWPDASEDHGVGSCDVWVIYGAGRCVISASSLPAGVYVPVKIQFDYNGRYIYGETGFTP